MAPLASVTMAHAAHWRSRVVLHAKAVYVAAGHAAVQAVQ
jgi:hypothetical protein